MKIRNLIHAATVAATMLLVASCTNEDLLDNSSSQPSLNGEEVAINFTYAVQPLSAGNGTETPGSQTRVVPITLDAIDGTALPIENMFVIQFDGNTSSSKMVGAPRFLDKEDLAVDPLSVPLIQNSAECYTLFVANIPEGGSYSWNISTSSTFADVAKRVRTIASEEGTYVTVNSMQTSTQTLLASAVVKSAVVPGTTLVPAFRRCVAKLTLNLTLDNSEMTILSVRLRSITTGIVYADAALEEPGVTGLTVYPTIDYTAITTAADLPTNGNPKSFSWYVPRNQRGIIDASVNAADKTFYAPDDATYFEIIAIKTTGSGTGTSTFRVYPGANETNDFNITANNHYTINLTIKGMGDDADSRAEKFTDLVNYADGNGWGSKSNSFILNPAPTGGGSRVYNIPVTQVNRYWKSTADGYGNIAANVIGDSDQWEISLIWSDHADLFGSYDTPAKIYIDNNNDIGYGRGKGPTQYFRLVIPSGMRDGNFTLGLKKSDSDTYLWSWHFWVTSYNPNSFNKERITDGAYTYSVPGGKVERYVDYNTTNERWGAGKDYEKSVMMDRPLGWISENLKSAPSNSMRGILHYQYGRKDPFPVVATTGGTVVRVVGNPITIKESMAMPNTFVPVNASPNSWASEALSASYIWCDPNAGTDKSIYDPCPPGWRMPLNGTWSDFERLIEAGVYMNTQNVLRDLGYDYGRGFGSATDVVKGLRYWPGETKDAPVGGTIWYPAAGCRISNNGALSTVGYTGQYWSASPSSTNALFLNFYIGSVRPSNITSRANGYSVRCVAEK